MDCSLLGFSVHGILLARILERVAVPSSRASSQPRDQTRASYMAGGFFTIWATREALDGHKNRAIIVALQHTQHSLWEPCSQGAGLPCHFPVQFTHCFSITFLPWSPNASDLHWRLFKYASETSPSTLSLSTPASSFAHKVPPAAGSLAHLVWMRLWLWSQAARNLIGAPPSPRPVTLGQWANLASVSSSVK